MKTPKTLSISLATAALIGSIGIAYAQTSTDATTPSTTTPSTQTTPGTMNNSTGTMNNSTGTMNNAPSDTTSTTDSERLPQADRN